METSPGIERGNVMRLASVVMAAAIALTFEAKAADMVVDDEAIPVASETEEGGSGWEFGGSIYLFAPALEGTIGVGSAPPASIDASFSDILDYLDFAFMAVGEARRDRFGILGDFLYTKLTIDGSGPIGLGGVSVTSQVLTATLMAEYRVLEQGRSSVDLMAGARLWGVTSEVSVYSPLGFLTGSGDEYWVDPMIGVKTRIQGNSSWYLNGWAMIGGFGAASEIDWDLFGGVGYQINDRWSVFGGYRGVGVDYESSDLLFDVIEHGPILGAVLRF